jgi:hypothetical protein
MNTATTDAPAAPVKGWTIGLWASQVLLAAMFGFAGFNKLTQSADALVAMGMGWVSVSPIELVRFIGFAEVAGALGMILPVAMRIMPYLTPLAALGFAVIQVLAMGVHAVRGEFMVLPVNLVLLAVSLFVFWGRTKKVPVAPRAK